MIAGECLLKLYDARAVSALGLSQFDTFAVRKAPPFSAMQYLEKSALFPGIPYWPGRKRLLSCGGTPFQWEVRQTSPCLLPASDRGCEVPPPHPQFVPARLLSA